MGRSVKFVSAIKDAIFNKKNGGKIFFEKITNWGSEGSLAKDHIFSGFSFVQPSLTMTLCLHRVGGGRFAPTH